MTYYFQAGTCTSEKYQFTVQKKERIRLFGEKKRKMVLNWNYVPEKTRYIF